MSWARLDDAILDNPKIIAAGPLGFALHVAAITWCARNLTDGLIPKRRVAQLLDLPSLQVSETTKVRVLHTLTPDDLAGDLVRIGLWHDRGEQYELHDFLDYNLSRAEQQGKQAKTTTRVQRWRAKRSCNAVTNAPVTQPPVPVPVPVPREEEQRTLSLRSRGARGSHRVPESETLTAARRADAVRLGVPAAEVEALWAEFLDVEFKTARSDWSAAWRNSCRRWLSHARIGGVTDTTAAQVARIRARLKGMG